jgi:hypothetical protein
MDEQSAWGVAPKIWAKASRYWLLLGFQIITSPNPRSRGLEEHLARKPSTAEPLYRHGNDPFPSMTGLARSQAS